MPTILVQNPRFRQKMKRVFLPTAVAVLLSACSGNKITESLKNEAYSNSEFYINKADQTSKVEDQQTYRLLAVRKLLDENKSVEAQNTLQDIHIQQLNPEQQIEYNLLIAQLSARQNNNSQALMQLKRLPEAQLSQSQLLRFYHTQALVAENQKDVLTAVQARSTMDRYLSSSQDRQENNDKTWALLRNANRGMLEQAVVNDMGSAGWVALAVNYHRSMSNPSELPQVIQYWKAQYPSHPATTLLPTELQNVTSFQQTQLNQVGLFLPLSGEGKILGEMIKQGFNDAKGQEGISVQTYDTDTASIDELLSQAKTQGVQTVIGPLLKPRVDSLLTSAQINELNVLALNSTPNVRAVARVCYYGLSPEAEARSGADRIYQDNLTEALLIVPRGDFGQRSADAFSQRWRQLTNKDANIHYYNDALEGVTMIQNNVPTRQTGIYILGTGDQLLDIKQAIDNAGLNGQFPIYTSSRSNSPNNGAEFRLTMEGVKFSEIPLLSDINSTVYQKADQLAQSDFSMMRLYALGSDAWLIANKFNEFRQIPGYKISGLTGVLSAGTNCNIERQMTWLEYRNGSIVSAD